jgi:putative phage-type endonuclease
MIRDAQWHERRAKGIGGSDAATILGVSPFKSPLRLWMEKRREIEPEDLDAKEHIYWGITLERTICDEYTRRTGRAVREVGETYQHPRYPWMLCNVDRDVITRGPRVILEAKNVSNYHFAASDWGMEGTAQVPPYYYAQCQHNCAVTDAAQCDMPVLIGGNLFRIYAVPRDEAFIVTLIEREQAFWESIASGKKPDPINIADLHLLFPNNAPGVHIDASDEAAQAWALLARVKLEQKRLKAEAKQYEFVVKQNMGEAEHLSYNGAKLATWRKDKSGTRRFRVHVSGIGDETEGEE